MQGMFAGKNYSSGNAVAGDVSAHYSAKDSSGKGFSAGITLSNLGTKMNYSNEAGSKYFLPANLGVGIAYTFMLDEDNRLTLAADGNHLSIPVLDSSKPNDYYSKSVISGIGSSFSNEAWQAAGGVEYGYDNHFFARAGYHYETKGAGNIRFISAGVGLRFNEVNVNVSYLFQNGNGANRSALSNTLKFSVIYDLDKK